MSEDIPEDIARWLDGQRRKKGSRARYHGQLRDDNAGFLAAVSEEVRREVPEALQIWLHGSRASGDHRQDSDWDFLVVVPNDTTTDRMVGLHVRGRGLAAVGQVMGREVDIMAVREG